MLTSYRNKLPEIIAALLILLFCYTGITKLIDHDLFKIALSQSELLSSISKPVSWTLPLLELGLTILLVIPGTRKAGFMIAFCVLALFTLYILYMLLFASNRPCTCGGVLKKLSWQQHIVFNVFFAALSFIGWQIERKNKRPFRNPVH
ncbi:MAG TPA: MauE/DoxX family redox-associated membrane protein [Chitinophagaceae bacterium]|nr:MauE/DoxX family redox-associated membrane protein [Chitinophagaceae bacterium]